MGTILAHTRRTAVLRWKSDIVSGVQKAVELPWYVLGVRDERETLRVKMLTGASFERGWRNVPRLARLEIQSRNAEPLRIYNVRLEIRARFTGLRWLMYNHRALSFTVFTTVFWAVEMAGTLMAWAVLAWYLYPREPGKTKTVGGIKMEEEDEGEEGRDIKQEDEIDGEHSALSDTSRTFPTFSRRQPPLHYRSPARVKSEEDEEQQRRMGSIPALTSPPLQVEDPIVPADADDEDEDADFLPEAMTAPKLGTGVPGGGGGGGGGRSDSGLGTSLESGEGSHASVRRRREKNRERERERLFRGGPDER